MARFNEILVARYARALQKLMGIKGTVPTPVLSSEIQSVLNLFRGVEDRYLEGWERFSVAVALPAGAAGTFNHIRLRNPVGSNITVVVEKLSVYSITLAEQVILDQGPTNVDLTGFPVVTFSRTDARGRAQPAAIISNQTVASTPIGSPHQIVSVPINQTYDFILNENQELPLLPGDAMQVRNNAAVTALAATYLWRERVLEEPERT